MRCRRCNWVIAWGVTLNASAPGELGGRSLGTCCAAKGAPHQDQLVVRYALEVADILRDPVPLGVEATAAT
jgi:hypothetical protein